MKSDMLFFLSDQHQAGLAGFAGNRLVQTPNLDRIAEAGTVFNSAYTACPLCVPARTALLTGWLASRTGVFGNGTPFRSEQPTFLHSLTAAGYETVLVGRMHFVGPDQRHGFARRLFPDITPGDADYGSMYREAGHDFQSAMGGGGCLNLIGGGNSHVLEYDRNCVAAAIRYLSQPHDRPQCIVVGTYAPHYPYVAPPEAYRRYEALATVPESWRRSQQEPHPLFAAGVAAQRRRRPAGTKTEEPVTEETVRAVRAAYMGLISFTDGLVGQVHTAWEEHLRRSDRPGVFCYASDHGDTAGEHGLFDKQTFFEGSAAVPMVFAGCGIRGGARLSGAVSLLDLGPTLCEMGGAVPPPEQDGRSLCPALREGRDDLDRTVISEYVVRGPDGLVAGRMVRRGRWKFIHYAGHERSDQLFDVEHDPQELDNRAAEHPEVTQELRRVLLDGWNPRELVARVAREQEANRGGRATAAAFDPERWPIPAGVCRLPLDCGPDGEK